MKRSGLYFLQSAVTGFQVFEAVKDEDPDYYKTIGDASKIFGISEDVITSVVTENSLNITDDVKCTSIRHNSELGWNIMVQKDTTGIIEKILQNIHNRIGFAFFIIIFYLSLSNYFLLKMNRKFRENENRDEKNR